MATFPSLEPDTRSYDLGSYAISEVLAAGGGSTRFSHSSLFSTFGLQLSYVRLPEASMQLLRDHYATQNGDAYSFSLPAIIWRGQSTPTLLMALTTYWKYAAPIEEIQQSAGHYDCSISLVTANGIGSAG